MAKEKEDKKIIKEMLDDIILIYGEMVEGKGEDCFAVSTDSENENLALISVLDGCGGLGARKYEEFQKHSGAYMASRAVSGGLLDWFHNLAEDDLKDPAKLTGKLRAYINRNLSICSSQVNSRMLIRGSMVRDFPTTLAAVLFELRDGDIHAHVFWAGDSRAYLLTPKGLMQISKDDVEDEDALSNLTSDGALSNVISSDGEYVIHYKRLNLRQDPIIVLVSTDGCFGYVPTPMEFEYVLLNNIVNSKSPKAEKEKLEAAIKEYAGDDHTMALASFNFGDFKTLKKAFLPRYKMLKKDYIEPLKNERSDELTEKLWQKYKKYYEKYL